MNKFERFILVLMFIFIAVAAIGWIGVKYFALLAVFDLLVGVLIGMVIFIPNRADIKYDDDIIRDLQFKDGKPITHQVT